MTKFFDKSKLSDQEIQEHWENAYLRFETPEQEVNKFISRFKEMGQKNWSRDLDILDIFSGRCNGIRALEALGFNNIEGVDISPNLLSKYSGRAKLYVADCRKMPLESNSHDLVVVQGGVHHLPELPGDLEQTFREVVRVLRPGGRFMMVEPWQTPYLKMVHFLSRQKIVRLLSPKFDAFETMTHYESGTYFNWLKSKKDIRGLLDLYFDAELLKVSWGKIRFIGTAKK